SEYIHDFYVPAARQGQRLSADHYAGARALARWKTRIRRAWPRVSLRRLGDPAHQIRYGERLSFEVVAELNGLEPEDVVVEALVSRRHGANEAITGVIDGRGRLPEGGSDRRRPYDARAQFTVLEKLDGGGTHYILEYEPEWCGRLSYQVRLYPYHELLTHPFELGLMVWL
ncbi:MAG: hypothetical protein L0H73_15960, partial [Nitrococcus sp.]|nr:hypothetical protein [Nitrococcus sp.]